ncbi:hypothetical protein BST83_04405 [Polaribacter filamentus]|uniref:Glucan endo-1,3-beta-D-glucosidase n=1 Tax=Polaribacter filamentus TaxID=53483 RepID=A0A2S7KVF5_9FLAO|nr:hypothetical protein [Polaribacter filamentus]PQB06493.1 hypothetical protein BST83_04405 [Polaribacter filamentus]
MNLLKKGSYILLVFLASFTISCEDDNDDVASITGLDFVVATLNSDGTKTGVIPTTAFGNGNILYTVDFGATADSDTDLFQTSAPMVTYDYPDETMTYIITVTASLEGVADVSITKEHKVTFVVAPPPTAGGNPLAGTWRLAPESGAFGVGPAKDNVSWFSSSADDVTGRACLFDDEYVFNADGTFSNVLGADTWLEGWQGATPDGCGTPVFPHDGSAAATFTYDAGAGAVTLNGKGAYLGLSKPFNGGELAAPGDAPDSITYIAVLDGDTLELDIEIAGGGFWSYKLVRDAAPSIEGTWKLAPESGAFGVGPAKDNVSWFSSSADDVTGRACLFDDEYVFNADGTFSNVLGADTWLEGWQGATPDGCGTPVFPHDGSAAATFTYDAGASAVTLNGKGAYLGLSKPFNGGELAAPGDAPGSITYIAVLDGNTLELDIEIAGGGFWSYKLVRQ